MLTEKIAYSFLNDVLQIERIDVPNADSNVDYRLQFLDKISYAFQHKLPFQNLILLSTRKQERSLPTNADIIKNMSSKNGGLCYGINLFMCELLKAFGYNAYIGLGSVDCSSKLSHALVLIRDVVREGDLYLVDVGFGGFPSFKAVCLNFDKDTEIFHQSFSKYKYARKGDVFYRLKRLPGKVQTNGQASNFTTVFEDGWAIFYQFNIEEKLVTDKQDFSEIEEIYVDDSSTFLNCVRVSGYINEKAVAFKDNILLTEDMHGKLEAKEIPFDDLPDSIISYFPQFEKDMVVQAVLNFRRNKNL